MGLVFRSGQQPFEKNTSSLYSKTFPGIERDVIFLVRVAMSLEKKKDLPLDSDLQKKFQVKVFRYAKQFRSVKSRDVAEQLEWFENVEADLVKLITQKHYDHVCNHSLAESLTSNDLLGFDFNQKFPIQILRLTSSQSTKMQKIQDAANEKLKDLRDMTFRTQLATLKQILENCPANIQKLVLPQLKQGGFDKLLFHSIGH